MQNKQQNSDLPVLEKGLVQGLGYWHLAIVSVTVQARNDGKRERVVRKKLYVVCIQTRNCETPLTKVGDRVGTKVGSKFGPSVGD